MFAIGSSMVPTHDYLQLKGDVGPRINRETLNTSKNTVAGKEQTFDDASILDGTYTGIPEDCFHPKPQMTVTTPCVSMKVLG